MSFENFQLPDFLLVDFYRDTLVELDNVNSAAQDITEPVTYEAPVKEAVSGPTPLRFLGENKKNIAVLVHDEDAAFINNDDLQFLTNVLKACNLTIGDIAILNTNKQQVSYGLLSDELQPSTVLLFDVDPLAINLPFSIPDFQVQVHAGCTYMKSPALGNINQASADARALKVSLWQNLQKIFGI